jgi:hypothetical protein
VRNEEDCVCSAASCCAISSLVVRLLTLSLLMSYIYGAPCKARNFNVVYIWTYFGKAETVSFYLLHNVSTLNQCIKLSCGTVVCKHFASYQGYPNSGGI